MELERENVLLELVDLRVSFPLDEGTVQALDGVNLGFKRGEVLGVVGESGCGKTVTAQSILRILPSPGRIDKGQILYYRRKGGNDGRGNIEVIDIAQLEPSGREMCQIRGKEIAMVFQEPISSFSPVHTIGNQIEEAILLHQDVEKRQAREMVVEMLDKVGIPNAARRFDEYPHEFSGGMRQRAMIAMTLCRNPTLLIADEPTTALDVTIQAQILDLMVSLQQEFGMAIMFITHNLGVVAQITNEVAIMYLGRVVEHGPVHEIYHHPQHPYTVNLLQAIPYIGKTTGQRLFSIKGGVPSPFELPRGCPFHPRCERMIVGLCDVEIPRVTLVGESHTVSCFLYV